MSALALCLALGGAWALGAVASMCLVSYLDGRGRFEPLGPPALELCVLWPALLALAPLWAAGLGLGLLLGRCRRLGAGRRRAELERGP